jgi:hypothetical protein
MYSAGTADGQRDKKLSPTWLSFGCCSALNFVQPYIYLMKMNNWTSVYMVVDLQPGMIPVIADVVAKAVAKIPHAQQTTFFIPIGGRNSHNYDIVLQEFNRSSRGLLFILQNMF